MKRFFVFALFLSIMSAPLVAHIQIPEVGDRKLCVVNVSGAHGPDIYVRTWYEQHGLVTSVNAGKQLSALTPYDYVMENYRSNTKEEKDLIPEAVLGKVFRATLPFLRSQFYHDLFDAKQPTTLIVTEYQKGIPIFLQLRNAQQLDEFAQYWQTHYHELPSTSKPLLIFKSEEHNTPPPQTITYLEQYFTVVDFAVADADTKTFIKKGLKRLDSYVNSLKDPKFVAESMAQEVYRKIKRECGDWKARKMIPKIIIGSLALVVGTYIIVLLKEPIKKLLPVPEWAKEKDRVLDAIKAGLFTTDKEGHEVAILEALRQTLEANDHARLNAETAAATTAATMLTTRARALRAEADGLG